MVPLMLSVNGSHKKVPGKQRGSYRLQLPRAELVLEQ